MLKAQSTVGWVTQGFAHSKNEDSTDSFWAALQASLSRYLLFRVCLVCIHRIIECLGLEEDFKDHQVSTPCHSLPVPRSSSRSSCSGPRPTWPWAPPGMEKVGCGRMGVLLLAQCPSLLLWGPQKELAWSLDLTCKLSVVSMQLQKTQKKLLWKDSPSPGWHSTVGKYWIKLAC